MSDARPKYDPGKIEPERQAAWAEAGAYDTPDPADGQEAVYIKPSSPFTSGNLHMGHVRDYTIGDAYARYRRARGDAVLLGFGFDAFGLPAEMAAIERGVRPADWVVESGERMLEQMKRLGYSFDYGRTFYSSDESQYRWSQWLFVTLLEAGLVYRDDATVDWCDSCQTTLAALQVEDGRCWRCHNEVRLIRRPTWFLRVTPFLEENDANLERFENWNDLALKTQRYILGRTDGVELDLADPAGSFVDRLHPAPRRRRRGPLRARLAAPPRGRALDRRRRGPLAARRAALGRLGAQRPRRRRRAGDRHRRLAGGPGRRRAAGLRLADRRRPLRADRCARHTHGRRGRRGDRRARAAGCARAVAGAGASGAAAEIREAKRYRASDFSIGRQRYWGTPIPIVNCESCGPVPVPVEELPVVLPRDIEPTGEGNPLAERPDFVDTACPRCGEPARRETDTLDCHFDALWLWVPAAVPPEGREEQMFTHPDLRRWLPSERLVAGNDSGSFVFDQRAVTKALRDIGPFAFLEDGEPFAGCLFHEMVVADGRKMSKHLGNVVDPDELVARHGADTVRLAILYAAGPSKTLNWNDGAMRFAGRFLNSLWDYALDRFGAVASAPVDEEAETDTALHARAPASNGATTASPGSPKTWPSCRCTRRCATSPASSSGSRTSRSASSSAAAG